MTDPWTLPTRSRGAKWTLQFCRLRVGSSGELSRRKEPCGDWRGAGVSASVEGTAGQPVQRAAAPAWAGQAECWVVLFSKTLKFGPSLHFIPTGQTLPRQNRCLPHS